MSSNYDENIEARKINYDNKSFFSIRCLVSLYVRVLFVVAFTEQREETMVLEFKEIFI